MSKNRYRQYKSMQSERKLRNKICKCIRVGLRPIQMKGGSGLSFFFLMKDGSVFGRMPSSTPNYENGLAIVGDGGVPEKMDLPAKYRADPYGIEFTRVNLMDKPSEPINDFKFEFKVPPDYLNIP